jgi:hypothetical protein
VRIASSRHIVVLRCDDAPLRGLLADVVYQDLVGVAEPEERRRRILAAAERRSSAERPQRRRGKTFVGVPPRIAGFTGRADELDRSRGQLSKAGVVRYSRHEGLAPVRLPRLETGSGSLEASEFLLDVRSIGLPFPRSPRSRVH